MKDEILAGTCRYILENGVTGLTLRPLAKTLDTSDRMILYYFETKDNLIRQAVKAIANQMIAAMKIELQKKSIKQPSEFIEMIWQIFTVEENKNATQLFFEIDIHSFRQPELYRQLASELMNEYLAFVEVGLIESGMSVALAKQFSPEIAAQIIGYTMLYLVTGENNTAENLKSLIERFDSV